MTIPKGQARHVVKLVRDLMRIGVTTCPADTPFLKAARILLHENLESLIVLDSYGHATGIFGRREVVETYARSGTDVRDLETITVVEASCPDIPEIPPDIPATAATQIMLDRGVRDMYLMHYDGGIRWPAAVLRFDDVLRYLAAESEADVADMGAGADRPSPFDIFKERAARPRRLDEPHSQTSK